MVRFPAGGNGGSGRVVVKEKATSGVANTSGVWSIMDVLTQEKNNNWN
jgi:hypothetical protein